jgi:hypothetical protein
MPVFMFLILYLRRYSIGKKHKKDTKKMNGAQTYRKMENQSELSWTFSCKSVKAVISAQGISDYYLCFFAVLNISPVGGGGWRGGGGCSLI